MRTARKRSCRVLSNLASPPKKAALLPLYSDRHKQKWKRRESLKSVEVLSPLPFDELYTNTDRLVLVTLEQQLATGDIKSSDIVAQIEQLFRSKKSAEAIQVLKDVLAADQIDFEILRTFVFEATRAHHPKLAYMCIEIARDYGVNPSNEMYEDWLFACRKLRKAKEALELFREMKKVGFSPSWNIYHSLFALVNPEHALQLLEQAEAEGMEPIPKTFTALLHCCATAGDCNRAREVLSRIQVEKRLIDSFMLTPILTLAGTSQSPELVTLVDKIVEDRGLVTDAPFWISKLGALGRCGDLLAVEAAIRRREIFLDVGVFNAAIHAFVQVGDLSKAMGIYREMISAKLEPDYVTFVTLLHGCQKAVDVEQAFDLVRQMRERGIRVGTKTSTVLIGVLCAANRLESAVEVYRNMINSEIRPETRTYVSLLDGCRREKSLKTALMLFTEAQNVLGKDEVKALRPTLLKVSEACEDVQRARQVKEALMVDEDYNFKPIAEFSMKGEKRQCWSGSDGCKDAASACRKLTMEIQCNTKYKPNYAALPLLFRQGFHKKERMDTSLLFHAEKKALAILLEAGEHNPRITVNLRMCIDCHEFFKEASGYLGVPITVVDLQTTHQFRWGSCSCKPAVER